MENNTRNTSQRPMPETKHLTNEEEKPSEKAMVVDQVTRDLARRDEEEKRN